MRVYIVNTLPSFVVILFTLVDLRVCLFKYLLSLFMVWQAPVSLSLRYSIIVSLIRCDACTNARSFSCHLLCLTLFTWLLHWILLLIAIFNIHKSREREIGIQTLMERFALLVPQCVHSMSEWVREFDMFYQMCLCSCSFNFETTKKIKLLIDFHFLSFSQYEK